MLVAKSMTRQLYTESTYGTYPPQLMIGGKQTNECMNTRTHECRHLQSTALNTVKSKDDYTSTYYLFKNLILNKTAMNSIRELLDIEGTYVRELMHM